MSKIKVRVDVYESFVETHEIIIDQDKFDSIGIDDSMYDYISNDTLIEKSLTTTNYDITGIGSVK